MKRLIDLKDGNKGKVLDIQAHDDLKHKLYELGILPGVYLEVLQAAPFGGPIKIKVNDYCLALRRPEAYSIIIEEDL